MRANQTDILTPQLARIERRSREILAELGYPADPDDFPWCDKLAVAQMPQGEARRYRRASAAALALASVRLYRWRSRRGDHQGAAAAAMQASIQGGDLIENAARGSRVASSAAAGGRERAAQGRTDREDRDRQMIAAAREVQRRNPHRSPSDIAAAVGADFGIKPRRARDIILPALRR